jgi:type IV pilus assembly protein PilE
MNHRPKNHGFSLIELLIVMVVASILAMIAVPSYQDSVRKSRRAEGKVLLTDTAQRLERCYSQFGSYDNDGCAIQDGADILSPGEFYTVTVAIPNATTFTLTAAPEGPQVDDEMCGELSLTNTGLRDRSGSADMDRCW